MCSPSNTPLRRSRAGPNASSRAPHRDSPHQTWLPSRWLSGQLLRAALRLPSCRNLHNWSQVPRAATARRSCLDGREYLVRPSRELLTWNGRSNHSRDSGHPGGGAVTGCCGQGRELTAGAWTVPDSGADGVSPSDNARARGRTGVWNGARGAGTETTALDLTDGRRPRLHLPTAPSGERGPTMRADERGEAYTDSPSRRM